MRWRTKNTLGRFALCESIEIDDAIDSVFAHWNRYEEFPRFMESVCRTKRINQERVLWDVDIAGHQIVWEARIVEFTPLKLVRWVSSWGSTHAGEVRFDEVADGRTALTVEISYQPQGVLERLGARLGFADLHVRRDLERFRAFVESHPREGESRPRERGCRPGRRHGDGRSDVDVTRARANMLS